MTKEQKKVSLQRYAEFLKRRLASQIPDKYKTVSAIEAFKQMLQIDLKKTLSKIETL
jgi:hypothetical protein